MTPDELITKARQRYNAVGDTFFSDSELYDLIWEAEIELAMETQCIEDTFSTTAVSGQREYVKPSNCIAVKHVTYNGVTLVPVNLDEDDILTGYDEDTTATGTPTNYAEWESSIFLRPTPNSSSTTIKLWFYAKPTQVTQATTLEVPEEYQLAIIDFIVHNMAKKDCNENFAAYNLQRWENSKIKFRAWEAKKRRRNQAAHVQNLDFKISAAAII
jgi:hypothetical protein